MQRIAILTAGGDTPALNATIHGAVTRANQLKVEVYGLLRGFQSLLDARLPHVHLNPLLASIPELVPTHGGTLLGSSRTYLDAHDPDALDAACLRLQKLRIDGLLCIGGDGTLNGMQALCDRFPTVLAPKTIDNDLGLNYPGEPNGWIREPSAAHDEQDCYRFEHPVAKQGTQPGNMEFLHDQMVNYVTPGYATAVFVSAGGVARVRTTAESHRRIAIVEVMGRHSGFIALGSAYGQPDIVLIPESPVSVPRLVERIQTIYDHQENVVIVCGEGIVDAAGDVLGASQTSTDPAGNLLLSGAAEQLRQILITEIGDSFFRRQHRNKSATSAIFTRKVGHTQRGGRPVAFDRFHASQLGGKAVDMLLEGQNNAVATLNWSAESGFTLGSYDGNGFRDKWGVIHARQVHPTFYDEQRMHVSPTGTDYLLPIFTNAIGVDDVEAIRQSLFDSGNLYHPYHSVNVDIDKRVRHLDT